MNVARVSVFTLSMLLAASSAFSLTCSPLSYQLATDTLGAKWAAPFNLMVQAHKVTVLARYCANNVLGAKLSIDGVDLKNSAPLQELKFTLIYADEVACPNRFLQQKLSQFLTESVRNDGIYFLEFDSSYSDWGYVHLPTRCGSSIWGIELSPLIISCMKKPECSEVWFYEQELPDHFHLPKYKD
jgi:hypothetical protein